jgi:flavoprotein
MKIGRRAAAGAGPVPVRRGRRGAAGSQDAARTELRPRFAPGFRLVRDKTASAVPVGMLYDDIYHTVVIAPATSNTVAKCVVGISDTLPTNMFAQAGKLGIPGIVFACDTEPVVITKSPHDWVTLRPRRSNWTTWSACARSTSARW